MFIKPKAFDRVEYVRLFRTLSDRNMCPIVLRLLMNMYINQSFQVKWNNTISSQSHVSNGVKQGGCLSPTLFSVYFNELIETLRKNNIGSSYGSEYMGVFCYADDLSLLCPSVICMRVGMCVCVYDCWGVAHPSLLCRSSKRLHPDSNC